MIFINGKLVDFSNRKDDYEFKAVVDDYHQKIKELDEAHNGVIRFVTREPVRIDPRTKMQRRPKGYSWLTKAKVVAPGHGQQIWVYTTMTPRMHNGISEPEPQSFQVSRGEVSFRIDEEPEFIYFLTKHRAVKRGVLKIYDPDKIEREKAVARRMETKFKDLIYSDNSPLTEDEEKLKMIARKWGIDGVDEKQPDGIRNALYDKVLNEEEKRRKGRGEHGIEEFISDFEFGDTVQIGSAIQRALDKGALNFNKETNEWLLSVQKDQMPLSLMMVQPYDVDRAREKLVQYLNRNKDDFATLQRVLKGEAVLKYGQVHEKGEVELPKEVNLKNLSKATYQDMQKAAKEIGLNVWGKKADEMRELLRKKLEELEGVETS